MQGGEHRSVKSLTAGVIHIFCVGENSINIWRIPTACEVYGPTTAVGLITSPLPPVWRYDTSFWPIANPRYCSVFLDPTVQGNRPSKYS